MNKYQEALDNLVHCKSITRCKECKHKSHCTMERDSNIIQELVNKEKPVLVTDRHVDEFYCPECGAEICCDRDCQKYINFCENCGQALEWSDKDE